MIRGALPAFVGSEFNAPICLDDSPPQAGPIRPIPSPQPGYPARETRPSWRPVNGDASGQGWLPAVPAGHGNARDFATRLLPDLEAADVSADAPAVTVRPATS
jgi:hypothetical protein